MGVLPLQQRALDMNKISVKSFLMVYWVLRMECFLGCFYYHVDVDQVYRLTWQLV